MLFRAGYLLEPMLLEQSHNLLRDSLSLLRRAEPWLEIESRNDHGNYVLFLFFFVGNAKVKQRLSMVNRHSNEKVGGGKVFLNHHKLQEIQSPIYENFKTPLSSAPKNVCFFFRINRENVCYDPATFP